MRIGGFEIIEPEPELKEPHLLAVIPWIDAGKAASLVLSRFEAQYSAAKLGELARPGEYYDFTRYRPTISRDDNVSDLSIPNIRLNYSVTNESTSYLFLSLPEPHMNAEGYIDSVVELMKHFGVIRYGLLGSVYDMVPHTRPPLVTGNASNEALRNSLDSTQVVPSDYTGPTTILHLINQKIAQLGIESFSLFVHIPGYITPEEDYRGEKRLIEILNSLYDIEMPVEDSEKALEQDAQLYQTAEQFLEQQPQLKFMLKQLEDNYDARVKKGNEEIRLSPEIEKFLKDLDKRFGQG
jgi:predicted ATP-grasp superfamily ATP-dependent carboligase